MRQLASAKLAFAIGLATFASPLQAQISENWILGESGAIGEADLKIDVAAAKRALGDDESSADAQKRMTKAMKELLRSEPGKNRLFDASNAPVGTHDVTADFVELVSGHHVEDSQEARLGPPKDVRQTLAPQVQAPLQPQARTERSIIVTGQRAEPVVVPQQLASESVPLVTLTYPETITPRAEAQLLETFKKLKWPAGCGGFMTKCSDNAHYLDQIIAKTTYFVPDVYAALTRELPANSVVIQPATLDLDGSGRFTYRLLNAELPSATTLDFIAFVAPRINPKDGPSSSAHTHGLYVLPALVASQQSQTRSSDGELFAISQGISPSGVGPRPSALAQLATMVGQKRTDPPQGVVVLDDKQLKIADAQWKHVETPLLVPALVAELMAGQLRPFVAAVKAMDRQAVERSQLTQYATLYSDAVTRAGPIAWALLPEFLAAEREFMNSDTLEGLKALREGEFGQSMRKMLLAERQQNKSVARSKWTSALTAGIGGAFAGASGALSAPQIGQMMVAVIQQQAAIHRAGEAFSASVGGVSVAQRSVVIQMGERQETVTARTISELRQKFRELLLAQAVPSRPATDH